MDYYQLIRRLPEGGHQSIADYHGAEDAKAHAVRLNVDYQTDEYVVIHRRADRWPSISAWWDGKKWNDA